MQLTETTEPIDEMFDDYGPEVRQERSRRLQPCIRRQCTYICIYCGEQIRAVELEYCPICGGCEVRQV